MADDQSIQRRPGFVLPAVVFGLVVMSIMAVAALRTSSDTQRSVRAFRESGLALYAADAGLRQTIAAWPTASVAAMNAGDSLVVADSAIAGNGSRYRSVIFEVDNGGIQVYTVIVQGRGAGKLAGQRTVEAFVTGIPTFRLGAIVANGNVSISSGSGGTDSYNSDVGAYNAATADSVANIVTNGNVSLTGGATVKGSVTASGTIANGGTITGGTTSGAPTTPLDTLACPTAGYTRNSVVPGGTGIAYNQTTGVLTVSGGNNITLTGNSYFFSAVVLSGGATLTLTNPSHVDMYVDSLVNISGGGVVNTSAKPTMFSMWSCGTKPASWVLSGGSGAYYTVYAPNHDVTVSGSGDIYGAVVSKAFTASGGSKVHYDKALLNARAAKLLAVSGSWVELTLY